MQRDLIGYTDGSCVPNPGFGSWAWVVVKDDQLVESGSGSQAETTNNRMEFLALIRLLEAFGDSLLVCRTDSQLLQKTAMAWRHTWKRSNWKNGEVKNLDLVQRLDELLDLHGVPVEWVRGHNGDRWNEFADEVAEEARVNGLVKGE